MNRYITALITLLLALHSAASAQVRLKDMGDLLGAPGVKLIGYGLVVGLDRTGDSRRSLFTNQSLVNMLERFGIAVGSDQVRSQNVAAVMVTCDVPAFSRSGAGVDVLVSSIGDARSLQGGVLLQTTMSDLAGNLWGVASGPITIGGFNVEAGRVSVTQGHSTVARIPDGLTLMRDMPVGLMNADRLTYMLRDGDFTTAARVAESINRQFSSNIAQALDAISVEIVVPDSLFQEGDRTRFVAMVENVSFEPDMSARVVINERTGTIVIGEKVTLATVAISHGTLSITIKGTPLVSQPPPFSPGETVTAEVQAVTVEQRDTGVVEIPGSATVGDVATALNRLGVGPRDMIAIFQALKQAGALHADLVVN